MPSAALRLEAADQIAPPLIAGAADEDKRTRKFHTTRRFPIYYMSITKCGSTYLKNLFYALDHDGEHGAAADIHDHAEDLLRATGLPFWMIRRSKFAFTVVREPASRFLSLYFDKIYGDGPQNFPELRQEIATEAGLNLARGLDAEAHRDNCHRFLGWLEKNLSGDTDAAINPHWRPQSRRIATVADFRISFLTLDGLDWQLPAFLGPVVPDIAEKMARVRTRNKAAYPVPSADVLDDALRDRVAALYAEDQALYERVSRWWAKNGAAKADLATPPVRGARIDVLTTYRHNLNVIAMPKAGISYLRNLTYALDHGRQHPTPEGIVQDNCLRYATRTAAELKDGVNVIVLRDPVARFFSLYFDKVWNDEAGAFPWITARLRRSRVFHEGPKLRLGAHRDNCRKLLGFLRKRFDEQPLNALNPHWRPQSVRVEEARKFGFVPIILEEFDTQFRQVADGRIRGLDAAMAAVTFRNASTKPKPVEELNGPWITERLHALYGEDIALYQRIKAEWAEKGQPPEL